MTKAINNPKNTEDMCRICGKAQQTKRFREHIERGGVKPHNVKVSDGSGQ